MEDKKIIDITADVKRAERKRKFDAFLANARDWAKENAGTIVVGAPIVAGVVGKVAKVLGRRHNLKLEKRNKELFCYDPSLGHYWELKRKLGNKDWTKINRRDRKSVV